MRHTYFFDTPLFPVLTFQCGASSSHRLEKGDSLKRPTSTGLVNGAPGVFDTGCQDAVERHLERFEIIFDM